MNTDNAIKSFTELQTGKEYIIAQPGTTRLTKAKFVGTGKNKYNSSITAYIFKTLDYVPHPETFPGCNYLLGNIIIEDFRFGYHTFIKNLN